MEEMSQLFQGLDLDTVSEHTSEVIGEMMEQVHSGIISCSFKLKIMCTTRTAVLDTASVPSDHIVLSSLTSR